MDRQEFLRSELTRIQTELYALEQEKIEQKRKEFVPGYFKYNNGYSNEDRWWSYTHALEMDSDGRIKTFSFEETSYGEISIKFESLHNFEGDSFYIPITREEWEKERKILWKKIQSLG